MRSVESSVGPGSRDQSIDDVQTTKGGVDTLTCMIPSDDFQQFHLEFASPLVEAIFRRQVFLHGLHDVASQLLAPTSTRGVTFEGLAHCKFREGNVDVSCAALRADVEEKGAGGIAVGDRKFLTNCTVRTDIFPSKMLPDVIVPNVYYVPRVPNFPVIDSFVVWEECLYLLQMKSATSGVKDLDKKANEAVRDYCATVKRFCLSVTKCLYVFVVPSDLPPDGVGVFAEVVSKQKASSRKRKSSALGAPRDGSGGYGFDLWVYGVRVARR